MPTGRCYYWAGFLLSLLFCQTLLTIWLHAPLDTGEGGIAGSAALSRAQWKRDADCADKIKRARMAAVAAADAPAPAASAAVSVPLVLPLPLPPPHAAVTAPRAVVRAAAVAPTAALPPPAVLPLSAAAAAVLPLLRSSSSGGGCPASFMSGTDFAGSDLRMETLSLTLSSLQKQQKCCEACAASAGCGGWTQANDACWLKRHSNLRKQQGLIGITSGFRPSDGAASCQCNAGGAAVSSAVDAAKELDAVGLFSETSASQSSCTEVCASVGRWCDASRFAEVNTCSELRRRFPCDACEVGYGLDLPGYRHFTVPFSSGVEGVCYTHAAARDSGVGGESGGGRGTPGARAKWEPRCDGAFKHSFRLCPCAQHSSSGGSSAAQLRGSSSSLAISSRRSSVGFSVVVTLGADAVRSARAAVDEASASGDLARVLAWAPFEAVRSTRGGKVDFVVAWSRFTADGGFEAAIIPARTGSIAVTRGVSITASKVDQMGRQCTASGGGLTGATVGKEAHFTIVSRNDDGTARTHGGDVFFTAIVKGPMDTTFPATVVDNGDGTYGASYTPLDGAASDALSITIRYLGIPIKGSPFRVPLTKASSSLQSVAYAELPLCRAASTKEGLSLPGRWVGQEWRPQHCRVKRYTTQEAQQCLRGKHVVFFGDSHIRRVFHELAVLLSGNRASQANEKWHEDKTFEIAGWCVLSLQQHRAPYAFRFPIPSRAHSPPCYALSLSLSLSLSLPRSSLLCALPSPSLTHMHEIARYECGGPTRRSSHRRSGRLYSRVLT